MHIYLDGVSLTNISQLKYKTQQLGCIGDDIAAIVRIMDIITNMTSNQLGDTNVDKWYKFNLNILAGGIGSYDRLSTHQTELELLISKIFNNNDACVIRGKASSVREDVYGRRKIQLPEFAEICTEYFYPDYLNTHLNIINKILVLEYLESTKGNGVYAYTEDKGNSLVLVLFKEPKFCKINTYKMSDLFATAIFGERDVKSPLSIPRLFNDKELGILVMEKVSLLKSNLPLITELANCSMLHITNKFSANALKSVELSRLKSNIHFSAFIMVAYNLLKYNLIN